jgi:hypothetical protein
VLDVITQNIFASFLGVPSSAILFKIEHPITASTFGTVQKRVPSTPTEYLHQAHLKSIVIP